MKKIIISLCSIAICIALLVSLTGCGDMPVQANDLMEGVEPQKVETPPLTDVFSKSTADFSIKLLQQTYTDEKNTLVAPLSVLTALAMTANGADGETLTQMEKVLGGGQSIADLNGYLKTFFDTRENTEKVKFTTANSIWFRDDADRLTVEQDFLQKNADYYGAAAYKAPFDNQTVKDINRWVKQNTDGMIKKVVDEISPETMLYLINTLVFDGEWQVIYKRENVRDGIFTNINGEEQSAKMMYCGLNQYLEDGMATGFVKNYAGGQYSFVALLPNEGVSLSSYVESLTGEKFRNTFLQAKKTSVKSAIPKFSYDCNFTLNDGLKAMGLKNAFDGADADFSAMGHSVDGNLYIGRVVHKTFISVDERGTKAGAVTSVQVDGNSAPMETYMVHLDRPFVYAIVDNATGLPVFMGTVVSLAE